MIRAVHLTENSWILYNRTQKCGLMRKIKVNSFGIIGGPYTGTHKNLESLEKKIGDQVKFQKIKNRGGDVEESYIKGFPVKHIDVFDINEDNEYPSYAKKKGSQDRYAAGYWCLQFKDKWQSSYCPRVKTVKENPHMGPYKTKMEMEHCIRVENNKQ